MMTRFFFKGIAVSVAVVLLVFLTEDFLFSFLLEAKEMITELFNIIIIQGFGYLNYKIAIFSVYGVKIIHFLIADRVIAIGERMLDALMIFLIIKHGIIVELIIVTPLYLIYCVIIVRIYDIFLNKGLDLLGLEYLRKISQVKDRPSEVDDRFLRWILKKKVTVFLVGSLIRLDPDGVTLVLRKDRKSFIRNSILITLPSVILSMCVFSILYKIGISGVVLAGWDIFSWLK